MADPISAVGTIASTGFGSVHSTLSVSPTTAGDVLVFSAVVAGTGITVSTVSGGGVTSGQWTRILTPVQFTSPNVATQSMEMWLGPVTTTGSSTITVTFTTTTTNSALYSQQFTSGGGPGTVWALDGVQTGSKNNSTASTTITFPTLTPGGSARAYVGLGYAGGTGSISGATAGYTVQLDTNHNPFIYDSSVASAQSPTSVQTSAKSDTIAALITATNPASRRQLRVITQAINRASRF